MKYRIEPHELTVILEAWDELFSGEAKVLKIHLIACGGTALTLLGYKESTKDVDFLVPHENEYQDLVEFLKRAGYSPATSYGWKRSGDPIIFDIYPGNKVYTTELLESPLKPGGNQKIREWKKIYLGALNPTDLIISKMFRGTETDVKDSLILLEKEKINLKHLEERYRETASYDVSEVRVLKNFEVLLKQLKG